jgi:hypothetical protein
VARLIEVQDVGAYSLVTLRTGDALLLRAAGVRIQEGGDVIEVIGPFVAAVLGDSGDVITPMGPPNTILLRARQSGRAVIDVITGDPFYAPGTTTLNLDVQP